MSLGGTESVGARKECEKELEGGTLMKNREGGRYMEHIGSNGGSKKSRDFHHSETAAIE